MESQFKFRNSTTSFYYDTEGLELTTEQKKKLIEITNETISIEQKNGYTCGELITNVFSKDKNKYITLEGWWDTEHYPEYIYMLLDPNDALGKKLYENGVATNEDGLINLVKSLISPNNRIKHIKVSFIDMKVTFQKEIYCAGFDWVNVEINFIQIKNFS